MNACQGHVFKDINLSLHFMYVLMEDFQSTDFSELFSKVFGFYSPPRTFLCDEVVDAVQSELLLQSAT